MSHINNLLADDAIELNGHADSWREALELAGGLLGKTGATTSEYTAAMVKRVEDSGPYIVLAPGFAFAHSRTSPAVKRTAMAWVRLDEPVEFGHHANDPVRVVVALAALDDTAHLSVTQELGELLGHSREQLGSVTSVDELRAVLTGKNPAKRRGFKLPFRR
ncbi:PTS sugar transporter subunit IIA [Corynebacterium phoceense]|uniref:PTS sugar transporter subunit IIA n=1 Tax=Corynebacterium phoceense TaxID=1686286 RepID=UPI00211BBFCC|nr:PTS sugar transporter subunit IIA [Corynebacterium phoceense]MCQ9335599.1 PTS sugar transporter subunit IIA [Corynebacterium phoceense]